MVFEPIKVNVNPFGSDVVPAAVVFKAVVVEMFGVDNSLMSPGNPPDVVKTKNDDEGMIVLVPNKFVYACGESTTGAELVRVLLNDTAPVLV